MDGVEPTITLNVRFQEWEYYDVNHDCVNVQYQAVTDYGTWVADVSIHNDRERRIKRKAFQDSVLGCMSQGMKPHEVELCFG